LRLWYPSFQEAENQGIANGVDSLIGGGAKMSAINSSACFAACIGMSNFEAQVPIAPLVDNNIGTAAFRSDDSKSLVLLSLLFHLALF
jgi:hypothetical protein